MFSWLSRLFSSLKRKSGWRGFDAIDTVSVDDSDDWKNRQV